MLQASRQQHKKLRGEKETPGLLSKTYPEFSSKSHLINQRWKNSLRVIGECLPCLHQYWIFSSSLRLPHQWHLYHINKYKKIEKVRWKKKKKVREEGDKGKKTKNKDRAWLWHGRLKKNIWGAKSVTSNRDTTHQASSERPSCHTGATLSKNRTSCVFAVLIRADIGNTTPEL